MTLAAALREYLLSVEDVSSMTNDIVVGYANQNPADPRIEIQHAGGSPEYHHGGDNGLSVSRYTLLTRSKSAKLAHELDAQLRLALSGQRGTWSGYRIAVVFVAEPFEFSEPPVDASDKAEASIARDISIHHYRPIPLYS